MNYETDGERGMDKNMEEKLFEMHAEVCASMANPTRLKIMNLLRDGEKSVEELKKHWDCRKRTFRSTSAYYASAGSYLPAGRTSIFITELPTPR